MSIVLILVFLFHLLNYGFDAENSAYYIAYCIGLIAALILHCYLSTKKLALGCVVPVLLLLSFYPVYRIIRPDEDTLVLLVMFYIGLLTFFSYIWFEIRKDINKEKIIEDKNFKA